jgi:error-prone DNA polymerase
MSRKRSLAALEAHRQRFVEGAARKRVDDRTANDVYDTLVGFSGFGFPKSHAAAFGLLAYQSAWLRHHYPAEFLCGLLNEQPMGFYPPASLVRDAQRRGVEVLPPDVNLSEAKCRLQRGAVRVGLGYVKGWGGPRSRSWRSARPRRLRSVADSRAAARPARAGGPRRAAPATLRPRRQPLAPARAAPASAGDGGGEAARAR